MATITAVKERINRLDQANFQILCDAILVKQGYPGIVSLGTKDGEEKTTFGTPDTYFSLDNGKYVFAEYTTQKTGLIKKIRSDLEKCLDEKTAKIPPSDISEIVYCHNSSNINPSDDKSLKKYCEEKGIKLTLIGIDLLAEMLMNYPSIIKDHLGLTVNTEQIQTIEQFEKQYNASPLVATLETVFLFREEELIAIGEGFNKAKIILLAGPAGTGKTRLALEYVKRQAEITEEKVYCIHDRSLPIYDDIKQYFEQPGNYFLFVDDANQLTELKHVVEYVNKEDDGYSVRIIMTVRDYALRKVRQDINEIARYEEVYVEGFSDEKITSLMKKHFGILNKEYLDRIVRIAEGNARIAMIAGKLASEANRLDAINDATELYSNYFGKVLEDVQLDLNSDLLISAGILAFLNAIHLDHIDPIMVLLEDNGISNQKFLENILLLHEKEMVDIHNDKAARFSEQCMANFILKYVFFDKKTIRLSEMIEVCFENYRERTINAVNTLLGVFRNTKIREYVQDEIRVLWNKLEKENTTSFTEYVKSFFPVNEIETLRIIQGQISREEPVVFRVEDINFEEGKKYYNDENNIITILGGFAYLDNFDTALDLFFQYYFKRPDLYMQFYYASTTFFSIDRNTEKHCYLPQIKFFTKLSSYSHGEHGIFVDKLFCEIAGHFLKLEFSPHESTRNGKGITLYRIPIGMTPGVKEYRQLIWKQLLALAKQKAYYEPIKEIIRSYGTAIPDCSKEVVEFDSKYIDGLLKAVLSPDQLEDCLIAQSLQRVFDVVGCQTMDLTPFFEGTDYRLYQLVTGAKYDLTIPYDERMKKIDADIQDYILSAPDAIVAFDGIIQIYQECVKSRNGRETYSLANGINVAMQSLSNRKEQYVSCISLLVTADIVDGLSLNPIVRTLFSILDAHEVRALLDSEHNTHRNEWLYSYYHEFPSDLVSQEALDGLYDYLKENSDREIQVAPYRDINFLDKYLPVDEMAIIEASKLILKKEAYSPFIVCLYFEQLFNEYYISPSDVVKKYKQDVKLLEKIYLFVIENGHQVDFSGALLHELFMIDKAFVKRIADWFSAQVTEKQIYCEPLMSAFCQEDNYLEIFDDIVDKATELAVFPSLSIHRIINGMLCSRIGSASDEEKMACWVRHYIELHCDEKDRMNNLFEAIMDISMERAVAYISYLIKCTSNYDVFMAIPLCPLSYSWSGSKVPLIESWIKCLERLLPLLSGLEYLQHKSRVQQKINDFRNEIKEEEIADILNG